MTTATRAIDSVMSRHPAMRPLASSNVELARGDASLQPALDARTTPALAYARNRVSEAADFVHV
jgi:hypothetical protein